MTSEDILRGRPVRVLAIVEKLRRIIRGASPEMTEKMLPGWRAIGIRHPSAGHIGAIFPLEDAVQFAFEHGVLLNDPDGILTVPPVTSKQVRYYIVRDEAEIKDAAFERLLLEAVGVRSGARSPR